MGIEFIAKKDKKFKHRRDEKFAREIQAANLMSAAPEKTVHQFRCRMDGDIAAAAGMGVLLFLEGNKINVVHLNKKIGVVMSPDATGLKKVLGQSGLLAATVAEVRPLAKTFLIQLS